MRETKKKKQRKRKKEEKKKGKRKLKNRKRKIEGNYVKQISKQTMKRREKLAIESNKPK
jgi:hypothetical protein